MVVAGAIAATLAAMVMKQPALVAVAPVGADGEPLCVAVDDATEPARLAWEATLFAAAIDAAAGRAWARERAVSGALWDTQLEQLGASAQLLGLAPDVAPSVGDAVAARLDVARLLHLDAARDHESAAGYRQRGRAICAVLEKLRPSPCVVDRLLACGALVGCWGRVVRWDLTQSGPRSRVFPPQREAPA